MVQVFFSRVYGDKAAVRYYDAAQPEVQEQFKATLQAASDRYLPHPLVLVDDEIVAAGHVDAYGIAAYVSQQLS
jgi:disulfide oxidoreductase YuzD